MFAPKDAGHAEDGRQTHADRRAESCRRGHRHFPADARAARRSRRVFRRTRGHQGGDRADSGEARARQAALCAIRSLRRRPRARRPRQLAHNGAARRKRDQDALARLGRTHVARARRGGVDRGAARNFGGDAAELDDRSPLPRDRDRRRVAAGFLHRPDPGLCLLLSHRLGASAARTPRRLFQPTAARDRFLSDR